MTRVSKMLPTKPASRATWVRHPSARRRLIRRSRRKSSKMRLQGQKATLALMGGLRHALPPAIVKRTGSRPHRCSSTGLSFVGLWKFERASYVGDVTRAAPRASRQFPRGRRRTSPGAELHERCATGFRRALSSPSVGGLHPTALRAGAGNLDRTIVEFLPDGGQEWPANQERR
jgi:hypothetical protein